MWVRLGISHVFWLRFPYSDLQPEIPGKFPIGNYACGVWNALCGEPAGLPQLLVPWLEGHVQVQAFRMVAQGGSWWSHHTSPYRNESAYCWEIGPYAELLQLKTKLPVSWHACTAVTDLSDSSLEAKMLTAVDGPWTLQLHSCAAMVLEQSLADLLQTSGPWKPRHLKSTWKHTGVQLLPAALLIRPLETLLNLSPWCIDKYSLTKKLGKLLHFWEKRPIPWAKVNFPAHIASLFKILDKIKFGHSNLPSFLQLPLKHLSSKAQAVSWYLGRWVHHWLGLLRMTVSSSSYDTPSPDFWKNPVVLPLKLCEH